jgi:diguanylate cyclase (GGDEF)-like protein
VTRSLDAPSQTPVEYPQHDIIWLRRFGFIGALATMSCGLAAFGLGVGTGVEALLWLALVMAAISGWLLLSRRLSTTGSEVQFLARMAVGLFVGMILLLPVVPELAPTVAMAGLIPVFVAVPFLDQRTLQRSSVASWAFCTAYVLAAGLVLATRSERGIGPAEVLLSALGTAVIMGLVLAIIRRYALADEDARFLALHDGLTGVHNRTLFMDRLAHALAREERRSTMTAVVYLDVDGFKSINDRHGHAYGDQVLRAVADRLGATIRAGDTVARVGGDEFAVLLEEVASRDEAVSVAQRLRDSTVDSVAMRGGGTSVTTSLGIAFSGDGGETPDALLRNADYAMYSSKQGGHGEVVVYHASLRFAAEERRAVQRSLRGVADRGELRLQFQPVITLHSGLGESSADAAPSGTVVGLEALVRWHDPERGRRMPDQFIGLAEETGDIVQLGRWVLEEACQRLHEWQRIPRAADLRMAVNLSARQLERPGFASDVAAIVANAGVAPSTLELEITEHVLVRDSASIHEMILRLRASGIRFAIDDFGTGYSSFGYLRDFPVDTLKLDRSFVLGAVGNQRGTRLLRGMVDVGAALGASIVAEGIETGAQLDLVRSLGCDLGQGYLLSRPVDADTVASLLREDRPPWEPLFRPSGPPDAHERPRRIPVTTPG